METDWSLIPDYMRDGIKRYIDHGIEPGSFMKAVICNDLCGAFARADHININRLKDYADFMFNFMPSEAWGNEDKYNTWVAQRGMEKYTNENT